MAYDASRMLTPSGTGRPDRRWLVMLGWTTLTSVIAGIVYANAVLQPIDDGLTALRFGAQPRSPTGSVVVVDIDGASLAAVGQWPWPRQVYAAIVDRLVAAGAADIAFDIDFSTASTPEADAAFEDALRRAGGSVILAVFQQSAQAGGEAMLINRPIERFASNSWPGTVNVRPDRDGAIRSFPFGEWLGAEATFSIPGLLSGRPAAIGESFLIDFSIRPEFIDRISAIELLEGTVDPARITGRKVIVGASAAELRDLFEVPVYGILPGAIIQALATESLLQGRALRAMSPTILVTGLALLALVFSVVLTRLRLLSSLVALSLAAIAISIATVYVHAGSTIVPTPAAWYFALLGFAVVTTAKELDLRRVMAAIFGTESRNNRTLLERVVSDSPVGVIVADANLDVISASMSASRILGLADQTIAPGTSCRLLLPPDFAESMANAARDLAAGSAQQYDLRCTWHDREIVLEVSMAVSSLEEMASREGSSRGSRVVCATFSDVTEARKIEARTAYLANHDDLTGLANRVSFAQRLDEGLDREIGFEVCGVLFFDLDRFKAVNDALGHQCGDLLLRSVADRATQLVGDGGLVARFGGDEYAVLAPGVSKEGLGNLADRLIEALSKPFMVDGYRVAVGTSVGATIAARGTRPAVVMREADLALNAAKDAGSGIVRFYSSPMSKLLDERRGLEVALWDALERQEFRVAYQPQVSLVSGKILGVEALIRWDHPTLGSVSPAQFIPVAEATGLIVPIGAQVLARACREISAISPTLRVAVNVSAVQFARGDLLSTLQQALADSRLAPDRLEIEITESLFLHSGNLLEDTLKDLRRLGVRFALDDFGTGYSSLSYLQRFPVDKIKIDRSFVSGLPFDQNSVGIVRAIAAMARALGIDLVAEGVENLEQVLLLRALGCNEGQGYLYGRAEAPEVLVEWLRQGIESHGLRA